MSACRVRGVPTTSLRLDHSLEGLPELAGICYVRGWGSPEGTSATGRGSHVGPRMSQVVLSWGSRGRCPLLLASTCTQHCQPAHPSAGVQSPGAQGRGRDLQSSTDLQSPATLGVRLTLCDPRPPPDPTVSKDHLAWPKATKHPTGHDIPAAKDPPEG